MTLDALAQSLFSSTTVMLSSKPSTKPLKGGIINANYANFNNLNANSLKLETISIAGVFDDGVFDGVVIQNSVIKNSIIGAEGSNQAYFTDLTISGSVLFTADIGENVSWDPLTGIFYISSSLQVDGLADLGNLRIQENTISAQNLNGDIFLNPNGLGGVYLDGPTYIRVSSGNATTLVQSGFIDQTVSGNYTIYSSTGNFNVRTFRDQTLTSSIGDIILTTQDPTASILFDSQTIQVPGVVYFASGGNMSGSTSGLMMMSAVGINLSTSSINIPVETKLNFGCAGSLFSYTDASLLLNTNNLLVSDPILRIGDTRVSTSGTYGDKGVSYPIGTSGSSGWFGYDTSEYVFSMYVPANIDSNNVVSGTLGNFKIHSISAASIAMAPGGAIDMKCGSILNVTSISGCGGVLNVHASAGTFIDSNLTVSGQDLLLSNSSATVSFGTSASLTYIQGTFSVRSDNVSLNAPVVSIPTAGSLLLGNASLISSSTGSGLTVSAASVTIDASNLVTNKISLGAASQTASIYTSSLGALVLTSGNVFVSSNHINLDSNTVYIPKTLVFNSGGSIYGTTSGLVVSGQSTTHSLHLIGYASTDFDHSVYVNGGLRIGTNYIQVESGGTLYASAGGYALNASNNVSLVSPVLALSGGSSVLIDTPNFNVSSGNVHFNTNTIFLNSSGQYRDVGIGVSYTDGTQWFGIDAASGKFTYFSSAVISSDGNVSGTIGGLQTGIISINPDPGTGTVGMYLGGLAIDSQCGSILNVTRLTGCYTLDIFASGGVTMMSPDVLVASDIFRVSSSDLYLGQTTNLHFSSSANVYATSSGTLVFDSRSLQVNGDLIVFGTTSNVYSTVTNIQDPIFSLGGITGTPFTDSKDRGIEFKWTTSTGSTKTGFYGFDNSTGRFVFIPDGINTSEVYSGTPGDIQAGNYYGTNLYIYGSIVSSSDLILDSSTGRVVVNSDLYFGSSSSLYTDTNGSLYVSSSSMYVPTLIFGTSATIKIDTSSGSFALTYNSSGSFGMTSDGNIFMSASNVVVPIGSELFFGPSGTSGSIYSDGTNLFISGQVLNIGTSDTVIEGNVIISGSLTATGTSFDYNDYILPLGTYQILQISDITLGHTSGYVQVTIDSPHLFVIGDSVSLRNTNSIPNIDGVYNVSSIASPFAFEIEYSVMSFTDGNSGTVKSNLTQSPEKDVGIQVNYWKAPNASVTSGTAGFRTGFFGFDNSVSRWVFYDNASIANNIIVSGSLGAIQASKVYTDNVSGFILDGGITGGSNQINGTNFIVGGGNINNTPIGATTPRSGRFTTLVNTVSANLSGVILDSTLAYSIADKYTMSSISPYRSPNATTVFSIFSVTGTYFTGSSGTMPSVSVAEGTYKTLVCRSLGIGCSHTVFFGENKLVTPNPIVPTGSLSTPQTPTKIVFKRQGQTANLLFDGSAWILLSPGVYLE